jgi:hypothetical protein
MMFSWGKRMSIQLITEHAPLDLRDRARRAAQWFNGSATWMPLALALKEIKQQKAYREWGFSSFSAYVEAELDLPRSTASELTLACEYLVFRHPEYLKPESSAAEQTPSYANIVILARHVDRLTEGVVETFDRRRPAKRRPSGAACLIPGRSRCAAGVLSRDRS